MSRLVSNLALSIGLSVSICGAMSASADEMDDLYYGLFIEPLYEVAYPRALAGDSRAQFYLGALYWDVQFEQMDPNRAFMWLEISYANGERGDVEEFLSQLYPYFTQKQGERLLRAAVRCIDSGYIECDPSKEPW